MRGCGYRHVCHPHRFAAILMPIILTVAFGWWQFISVRTGGSDTKLLVSHPAPRTKGKLESVTLFTSFPSKRLLFIVKKKNLIPFQSIKINYKVSIVIIGF